MYKQLTILFFLVKIFAFGQVDTVYLDAYSFECKKDKAKYYRIIENKTTHFLVTSYFKNCNKIKMTGKYLTKNLETKIGTFTYYDSIGNIDRIIEYDNGKRTGEWLTYYDYTNKLYLKEIYNHDRLVKLNTYYKDGKLKREEIFQDTTRIKAECYDSLGFVVPFYEFDIPAQYKGGMTAARSFLAENIKYPVNAVDKGIEGKCYLRFVIDTTGNVTDVTVIRGVMDCPECDTEAIRVIQLMENWKPAVLDGQKVNSAYTLPITFNLGIDEIPITKKWWQFWKRS
jgi:protein TonB